MAERCQDVKSDLTAKNHLRHFERASSVTRAAFDDRLFNSELHREFAELFTAAVNYADADTDLMEEGKLFGERGEVS